MRAANVVALPLFVRGLPTVLIEALTVGTPCVATNCPTGPQQIAKSGGALYLVDNASPVEFRQWDSGRIGHDAGGIL